MDPFDTLPLSPPADRVPVATNARFSFPALARSTEFDSAVFGTSTSRLLRPVVLNAAFGARFVNLAMNAATAYEQIAPAWRCSEKRILRARMVLVGLDVRYCVTGDTTRSSRRGRSRAWMYDSNRWRGYGEMFNLYAVQEAGQQFGILIGIRRQVYGSDGYTNFCRRTASMIPPAWRASARAAPEYVPPGERNGRSRDMALSGDRSTRRRLDCVHGGRDAKDPVLRPVQP